MILVFSDLHLGSLRSNIRLEDIENIVNKIQPDTIIFNGDTIDCMVYEDFNDLKDELKKLGNCVFIRGNHDENVGEHDNVYYTINNKRIKIFHGHSYGSGLRFLDKISTKINEWILKYLKSDLQLFFRRILSKQFKEGRYIQYLYNQRCELIEEFEKLDYDVVISGHTHYPEHSKQQNFTYINVGNWKNYVTIDDESNITLHYIGSSND